MKAFLSLSFLWAIAMAGAAAELRVATMDLQRVLSGYHKAQEAAKELKAREVSFLRELEALRLDGRRLVAETEDLRRLTLGNALSAAERDEKQKILETKLTDLQTFGMKFEDIKGQRETELRAAASRLNQSVIDDVMTATRSLGEREAFHLILNANRANPVAGDVLFAKNVEDVTEKILSQLNATRASEPASSPGKAGATGK